MIVYVYLNTHKVNIYASSTSLCNKERKSMPTVISCIKIGSKTKATNVQWPQCEERCKLYSFLILLKLHINCAHCKSRNSQSIDVIVSSQCTSVWLQSLTTWLTDIACFREQGATCRTTRITRILQSWTQLLPTALIKEIICFKIAE